MRVYEVKLRQPCHTRLSGAYDVTVVVKARSAEEAIRRAKAHALNNGFDFLKSKPLHVTSLIEVVAQLV